MRPSARLGGAGMQRSDQQQPPWKVRRKRSENLALIAFAEKEKDVKKAQYDAEVKREQATAAQAGPLAEQEAKKKVVRDHG